MFKKISFMVIFVLFNTSSFASLSEQPKKNVTFLEQRGAEFFREDASLGIIPGEDEENPSCCQCIVPCIISWFAIYYGDLLGQQGIKLD